MDASPTGMGTVLEQNIHPVLCISRRLNAAEWEFSQTQREPLIGRYLFGSHFTTVTDREAQKFVYTSHDSLAQPTAVMVQ